MGPALTLISLWAVGLLAGAVHPLGFLNAVAGLIAIGAFYAAFGVALCCGSVNGSKPTS